jgi:hypothetical protein
LCCNIGRKIRRELLCKAGRKFSDHYVVILEGELEEKYCLPELEFIDHFVVIVEREWEEDCCVPQLESLMINLL